jgi:DNA-binding transcriptional ArsR family regulator
MQIRDALDPDIASLASLIGDPSRALVLQALADGRALPAGELARCAGISAQTVSSHLSKLVRARLLKLEAQGRHRYYSLHDARVAQLLESLAMLAPPSPALTPTRERRTKRLRFARTCYRHVAGRAGVALTQALCAAHLLRELESRYEITDKGRHWFGRMGIDLASLRGQPLARRCLDWSERRPHLAGPLGEALAARLITLNWFARSREPRVLRLTETGRRGLYRELSLLIDPS